MKILTKEIINRMPGPRGQEGKGEDAIVHLKLFNPWGQGTWLVIEAWQVVHTGGGNYEERPLKAPLADGEECEQIHLCGWADIGYGFEFGTTCLEELTALTIHGRPRIEREKWDSNGKKTVKQLKG